MQDFGNLERGGGLYENVDLTVSAVWLCSSESFGVLIEVVDTSMNLDAFLDFGARPHNNQGRDMSFEKLFLHKLVVVL